jgi:hypothetical protein
MLLAIMPLSLSVSLHSIPRYAVVQRLEAQSFKQYKIHSLILLQCRAAVTSTNFSALIYSKCHHGKYFQEKWNDSRNNDTSRAEFASRKAIC